MAYSVFAAAVSLTKIHGVIKIGKTWFLITFYGRGRGRRRRRKRRIRGHSMST
jgi:hypothetical protein